MRNERGAEPGLSIVKTIYRTGCYLEEFAQRALAAAAQSGFAPEEVELVFINDGSPDKALKDALAVRERHPQARVLDLSRNFGHHKAMMTGLRESRGRYVFLLDSDLEESPEWLTAFKAKMDADGCDAVYGVQERRKGKWFERWSGELFYTIFNLLAADKVTPNSVTARLMTRDFVNALIRHEESEPFLFGLAAHTGFTQHPCPVRKKHEAPTSYTFIRKVRLAGNSILSFSSRPLVYISLLGFLMTGGAFSHVIWLFLRFLLFKAPPAGWTSLIVSIWFVGGIIILCLGIVSLYLANVFEEVKRRPYSIIRKRYE